MPHVSIAGIPFNTEDMDSDEKALLEALRHIDQRIAVVKDRIAVYNTALVGLADESVSENSSDTSGGV